MMFTDSTVGCRSWLLLYGIEILFLRGWWRREMSSSLLDDDEVRTSVSQNRVTATLCKVLRNCSSELSKFSSPLISPEKDTDSQCDKYPIDSPGWVPALSRTSLLQNRVYEVDINLCHYFVTVADVSSLIFQLWWHSNCKDWAQDEEASNTE